MTVEQELWWNWYCNDNKSYKTPIPILSLDEKISLIDPSFIEATKNISENHLKWLKWFKFGNINSIDDFDYEDEPELNISFSTKFNILKNVVEWSND
jgi:hypothetical protein